MNKRTQKLSKSEKRLFRSEIKNFSLGVFTGYPVLPGVSAPLSDGDREYREANDRSHGHAKFERILITHSKWLWVLHTCMVLLLFQRTRKHLSARFGTTLLENNLNFPRGLPKKFKFFSRGLSAIMTELSRGLSAITTKLYLSAGMPWPPLFKSRLEGYSCGPFTRTNEKSP